MASFPCDKEIVFMVKNFIESEFLCPLLPCFSAPFLDGDSHYPYFEMDVKRIIQETATFSNGLCLRGLPLRSGIARIKSTARGKSHQFEPIFLAKGSVISPLTHICCMRLTLLPVCAATCFVVIRPFILQKLSQKETEYKKI